MGDEDRGKDGPSLEPPSLGFRRRKRPKRSPEAAPAPSPETAPSDAAEPPAAPPVTSPGPPPESTTPAGPASAEPTPAGEPVVARKAQPVVDDAEEATTVIEPDDSPTTVTTPLAPTAAHVARPARATRPVPERAVAPSPPLFADEQVDVPDDETRGDENPADGAPWISGRLAAIVTGLVVGALVVGATAASLRLCTLVEGTSSCGGPGVLLLVAILVVAILVGTAMLRAARVPDPGSTSFLAVGLLAVIAMLFLVDQLFAWWMVIAIPLVSIGTYALSHWVTTTFVEPPER